MGFNRRKMEDQRRQVAEKQAAERRATDAQVLEDAERLIAAWTSGRRNPSRRNMPAFLRRTKAAGSGVSLVPLVAVKCPVLFQNL
jgi:hypothetical protein